MSTEEPKRAKIALDEFFGQNSIDAGVKISQAFNQDVFSPKDLDVSYTNLNYWDKQGILTSNRKGSSSWRNFNFIDYVWIKVIMELRGIGVPVDLIKIWKIQLFKGLPFLESLYQNLKDNEKEVFRNLIQEDRSHNQIMNEIGRKKKLDEKFAKKNGATYFLFFIIYSISTRSNVSIVFFKDGELGTWLEDSQTTGVNASAELMKTKTHIRVSISEIIRDFLLDERSTFLLHKIPILNPNEIRILEIVNSGEFESVKIDFKDKKAKSVEMTKKQLSHKKIVEIIQESKYQTINIKVHKGTTTIIENTVQEFLPDL